MRRLSLKSTLFGVDPEIGGNDKRMVCVNNQDVEVYEK